MFAKKSHLTYIRIMKYDDFFDIILESFPAVSAGKAPDLPVPEMQGEKTRIVTNYEREGETHIDSYLLTGQGAAAYKRMRARLGFGSPDIAKALDEFLRNKLYTCRGNFDTWPARLVFNPDGVAELIEVNPLSLLTRLTAEGLRKTKKRSPSMSKSMIGNQGKSQFLTVMARSIKSMNRL